MPSIAETFESNRTRSATWQLLSESSAYEEILERLALGKHMLYARAGREDALDDLPLGIVPLDLDHGEISHPVSGAQCTKSFVELFARPGDLHLGQPLVRGQELANHPRHHDLPLTQNA